MMAIVWGTRLILSVIVGFLFILAKCLVWQVVGINGHASVGILHINGQDEEAEDDGIKT